MNIPTDHGSLEPEEAVDELTYRCYYHNREMGLTAARLSIIFLNVKGMEARYKASKRGDYHEPVGRPCPGCGAFLRRGEGCESCRREQQESSRLNNVYR